MDWPRVVAIITVCAVFAFLFYMLPKIIRAVEGEDE